MTIALTACTTDAEWDEAVPILRQLWTDESASTVRGWRDQDRYRLLGLREDGDLVAVAGVFVQVVLHHERTAWVHDLVVAEAHRSEGYGARFLDEIEAWADERECAQVALVTREGRPRAREFYEETMEQFGYVYERTLDSEP